MAAAAQLCENDSMRPWKLTYDLALLTVYLAILAGIAIWVLPHAQGDDRAARSAGATRELARMASRRRETRRHARPRRAGGSAQHASADAVDDARQFPAIFFAATVFPAIILGFFLLVLRGVLRQSGKPPPA